MSGYVPLKDRLSPKSTHEASVDSIEEYQMESDGSWWPINPVQGADPIPGVRVRKRTITVTEWEYL